MTVPKGASKRIECLRFRIPCAGWTPLLDRFSPCQQSGHCRVSASQQFQYHSSFPSLRLAGKAVEVVSNGTSKVLASSFSYPLLTDDLVGSRTRTTYFIFHHNLTCLPESILVTEAHRALRREMPAF